MRPAFLKHSEDGEMFVSSEVKTIYILSWSVSLLGSPLAPAIAVLSARTLNSDKTTVQKQTTTRKLKIIEEKKNASVAKRQPQS